MTIPVLVVDQAGTMAGAEPVSLINPLPVLTITSFANAPLNANSAVMVASLVAKVTQGTRITSMPMPRRGQIRFDSLRLSPVHQLRFITLRLMDHKVAVQHQVRVIL